MMGKFFHHLGQISPSDSMGAGALISSHNQRQHNIVREEDEDEGRFVCI